MLKNRQHRSLMSVTIARSLDQALEILSERPDALILAGGTDLMVQINRGYLNELSTVIAVNRIPELQGWKQQDDTLVLGAGLTYAEMEKSDFTSVAPALAQAARTVGSPQIRNAGTLGGNLGTASPAGDTLPVLAALDAVICLRSAQGARRLPILEFITGVKNNARQPGELIEEVHIPAAQGHQEFCKIGPRNAMVISVASLALIVDQQNKKVRLGLGTVGPVPLRPAEAEEHLSTNVNWAANTVSTATLNQFSALAAAAAQPIDDHRGTAAYRRHAIGVMARRTAARAFTEETP
jgi:CO/xanthine dehydrogenase FAD-binding subunit